MVKPYDETMKKFVGANPQSFTDWLRPGATFVRTFTTELQSRDIFVDALCEIVLEGETLLLHLEFQRNIKADMPLRLLEYNVLATRTHKRRVLSCVIYLIDDGTIEESPLMWELSDGTELLKFHYISIRIWEVDPAEFTQPGREGILPLVLLTKGNATPDVVEMVIERLMAAGKQDLLPITKLLASLVFKDNSDYSQWLARRFAMLGDILRDTSAYQQIFQEGEEKGHKEGIREGIKEGIREGEILGLRRWLLDILQKRFPVVLQLAKPQVDTVNDPTLLHDAILKAIEAQSVEEVLRLLLELSHNDQ
jgi:predicted transposase YdaD